MDALLTASRVVIKFYYRDDFYVPGGLDRLGNQRANARQSAERRRVEALPILATMRTTFPQLLPDLTQAGYIMHAAGQEQRMEGYASRFLFMRAADVDPLKLGHERRGGFEQVFTHLTRDNIWGMDVRFDEVRSTIRMRLRDPTAIPRLVSDAA